MPNIPSDTITFFLYIGATNGRIINNPEAGEIDFRSRLTATNTDRIYEIDPTTKAVRVSTPGNPFSQFQSFQPMRTYAIKGKEDFDLDDILPHPDPATNSAILAAIRSILDAAPSPNPDPDPSPNPPSPNPVTYDTTIVGIGQGESASAAQVTLSGFVGDVLSFNARIGGGGLPASMNLFVGSIAPENQVALVAFDGSYGGDRFSYLVKAGNHPSIAVDTVFNGAGMTFANGVDRILA